MKPRHSRTTRTFGILFLATIAGCLCAGIGCRRRPQGPVVIYLVDTLRPDRMSTYGASRETSPAATALASEGVLFRNAFALSTWTRPSVATLLTSRLPSDVGALNRYGRLSGRIASLPELFQHHGWKTGAAVGNGNVDDPRLGFQRGFDRFDSVWGAGGDGKPVADEVVDKALAFVASQKSPRFFLYVHVVDPHAPYKIPKALQGSFTPAAATSQREELLLEYDRAIRASDEGLGRLVSALRSRGWWPSSLVIFLADHGEEFFEHGGLYHGSALYDEQTRVPLIVKYPFGEEAHTLRSDPVTLADVLPTLAGRMGWHRGDSWVGDSFWKTKFDAKREVYASEDLDQHRLYSLRRGAEKVIVTLYPFFRREYFRLDIDPGEVRGSEIPCRADAAAAATGLLRRLEAWRSLDLTHYPQIRFLKSPDRGVLLDLAARLGQTAKPFLTAEDRCRFDSFRQGEAFLLRGSFPKGDLLDLRLSADDRGVLPSYRVDARDELGRPLQPGAGAALAVRSEKSNFLVGDNSDQAMIRRLKSLGYLGGN